jgi:hypothetical protein
MVLSAPRQVKNQERYYELIAVFPPGGSPISMHNRGVDRQTAGDFDDHKSLLQIGYFLLLTFEYLKIIGRRITPATNEPVEPNLSAARVHELPFLALRFE